MANLRTGLNRTKASSLSALLALGPMVALAATLSVAPEAEAAPKCNLKPAACKLQEQREARRADTRVTPGPTPGTARLLGASKTAAYDLQVKAAEKRAAEATTPARAEDIRPASCNLKPAACWLQEHRSR